MPKPKITLTAVYELLQQINANNTSGFNAIELRFNAIELRFNAIELRFNAIELRLDRLDERVESLHGLTESLVVRVERLEQEYTMVIAALRRLEGESLN